MCRQGVLSHVHMVPPVTICKGVLVGCVDRVCQSVL